MPQTISSLSFEFAITADNIVIVINTVVVVLMSKIAIVNISHQQLHHHHGKGVHSKCAVRHGEERKEDCWEETDGDGGGAEGDIDTCDVDHGGLVGHVETGEDGKEADTVTDSDHNDDGQYDNAKWAGNDNDNDIIDSKPTRIVNFWFINAYFL